MKKIVKLAFIILVLFFGISVASANQNNANSTQNSNTNQNSTATQRLTEAKLRICQTKEARIRTRTKTIANLAENIFTKFNRIANQVENYYTNIVVPSGKKVSNYDELVAEIAAKKAIVQKDLAEANTDAEAFSCNSDNPKGQLIQIRTQMQTVKKHLKEYRTAIKNLIVAIRSVTGTENFGSANNS